MGRQVATLVNGSFSAGTHLARLDGASFLSSTYLVRLQTDKVEKTRRITVVK